MPSYDHNKIIEIIRRKGPCLPSDIYKELGTNLLFASAMLGEMVSSGSLKVTHLKRASSPYYYVNEQKEQLQNFSQYLGEKEKIAYSLLNEKKVLKDEDQTPLTRMSLRSIKDYAIPLNVNIDGKVQLFWKFYLLSNPEAEHKIKVILGLLKEENQGVVKEESKKEIIKKEVKREELKEIKKEEPKKIEEPKILNTLKEEVQKEIIPSQQERVKTKKIIPQDGTTQFIDQVIQYFQTNNIITHSKQIMNRQKTEIDFIIEVPSPVGKLSYYCKAKDKKKINDGDIASAFVQGQQKRLPTLVLINGEMTKKTKEMLNVEFKGLTVYKI